MTKNLIDQLPTDEQPIASKLNSLADDMNLSQSFQWDLETRLMEKAKNKSQTVQGGHLKIVPALAWGVLAVGAVFLLNWTVRSLASNTLPPVGGVSNPESSFAIRVRQGDICADPLALAHGLKVFITNEDKTGFFQLDPENNLGEARSFAWSADGERLAIVGNTTGSGNIYITDPTGGETGHLLSASEAGI